MIFNMVGGGAGGAGGGATLVVSSPANVSVTVSKDDKSYTKNSGSLGSTTFKGLATGTWTVTISGNGQTATKTIVITADYAITIAFFSATISITYPATSTCVVTNSNGQTVASDTNSTSSEKTFTATVNATGTYTVTATATDGSGKSKSQSVSITTDGQAENVTLTYELYLLQNGVQKTEFKTNAYAGTVTFESSAVKMEGNTTNLCTSSKIDVSAYSSLKFTYSDGYSLKFGVRITDPADHFWNGPDLAFVEARNASSPTTVEVDISSINQAVYVQIQSLNNTAYIYSIWLE